MAHSKKTETTAEPKSKKEVVSGIGTKELAEHLGISPRALRIVIRREENDGNYTRYRWTGLNDPNVKKLIAAVKDGASKPESDEKKPSKKDRKAEKLAAKNESKKAKKAAKPADDDDDEDDDEE